jgi:hypothetical protein
MSYDEASRASAGDGIIPASDWLFEALNRVSLSDMLSRAGDN